MAVNICFDVGGTRLKVGLIEDDVVQTSEIIEIKNNKSIVPLLDQIEMKINQYRKELGTSRPLSGIGLAFPSIIDVRQNKILSKYVKYRDADTVDFNEWGKLNWGVNIQLMNDAKAALIGEWKYGAGKNHENLCLVTFGTGIGTSVIVNGRMLHGKNFIAGNLMGHSTIDFDGNRCNCGNIGCVEQVASTWSLPETLHNQFGLSADITDKTIDFKYIIDKIEEGDTRYKKVFNHCLDAWSAVIINLTLAYDPEIIICSGGIMASHKLIFPHFINKIEAHGWIDKNDVSLCKAEKPDFAALMGLNYELNQKIN